MFLKVLGKIKKYWKGTPVERADIEWQMSSKFFFICMKIILCGSVIGTKVKFFIYPKEKKHYPLLKTFNCLEPVDLSFYRLKTNNSNFEETYIFKHDFVVIYKNFRTGKYEIDPVGVDVESKNMASRKTRFNYVLENSPEYIQEQILFNINLFR